MELFIYLQYVSLGVALSVARAINVALSLSESGRTWRKIPQVCYCVRWAEVNVVVAHGLVQQ